MTLWRFIGIWLALDACILGIWCVGIIAQTVRHARHNRERSLAEAERAALYDQLVIIPVVKSPVHDWSL